MDFFDDFKDFVSLLNDYHVDYMIVGGYAWSTQIYRGS